MKGATAKKLRKIVYGEDFSSRNEGKYVTGNHGWVCAGLRGRYRKLKRDFNHGRLMMMGAPLETPKKKPFLDRILEK